MLDTKRLNCYDNLKFMPFGKNFFFFMPFGNYATWELTKILSIGLRCFSDGAKFASFLPVIKNNNSCKMYNLHKVRISEKFLNKKNDCKVFY